MKCGLTLARAKSPTSPAKGLRRLPHRLPALRGPEKSDVLVHGSRRRWDRLNSNTSETAAHVVIGRPHGLRLGFRDNVFPATPIASVRLWQIVLQNSQNAVLPISRKQTKRAEIAEQYSLQAVTEVACELWQDNVVPQMIIRSPNVRSGEFAIGDAKRLLQQYRHKADATVALVFVRC